MTTAKKTKYDKLETKFVETAQEMLDNFGINLDDLHDILNDNFDDEEEEEVAPKALIEREIKNRKDWNKRYEDGRK